jgi:hypothetical protein
MMVPKLKRRGAWPGIEDPVKQALVDIEKNASDAVDLLAKGYKPAWNPVLISNNYQAQLWDLVVVRTDCIIMLPASGPVNIGAEVGVIRVGWSSTVIVRPLSGTINGTISDSGLTPDATRIYVSSGEGWFRFA